MVYSNRCICGYVSYTFQKFFDISLMIPNIWKALFNNIIFENLKSENLECIYPCENCGEIFSLQKEQKFLKLPKILVISLQRFNQFSDSTIKTEIYFPNIIDLSNFIDKDYLKD